MFGRRKRSLSRPAVAGEVCTCGAAAVVVFDDPRLGLPFGSCLAPHAIERSEPCRFCGVVGPHATTGVCPAYVLRPAWATRPAQRALAATTQTGEAA